MIRRHDTLRRGVATSAVLVLLGCASDPGTAPVDCEAKVSDAERSACYSAHYFGVAPELPAVPDCDRGAALELGASAFVRGFRGAGATDVEAATRALGRYYTNVGLAFRTGSPAAPLAARYLITGSRQELTRALDAAGVPRDGALGPAEQRSAGEAIAAVLFRPLREFLRDHAASPDPALNFAVVERVVDPDFAAELGLSGELTGLGLSPALIRRLREAGRDDTLAELLELPDDFAASAFVASAPLAALDHADNAVAHEVGHALGLPHAEDPTNLMHPNVGDSCRAVLAPEQAGALVGIVRPALPGDPARDPLADLHRAAVTSALAARRDDTRCCIVAR